jgi:hypothetical protein
LWKGNKEKWHGQIERKGRRLTNHPVERYLLFENVARKKADVKSTAQAGKV